MTRKRKAKDPTQPTPTPLPAGGAAPTTGFRWAVTGICLLVAVLVTSLVWAQPRPIGDLYVALVGGQEVVEGKLGGLDEWSFVTADRVWINQNWGMHLITYLAYLAAGETGMLVFKAALMLCMTAGMVLAARERGAVWAVAIITTGALVLGCNAYIDMRPNLVALAFAPVMLWLLYRTRRSAHWAWPALVWAALWANMHGSFLFGLGLLGLWALCLVAPRLVSERSLGILRQRWPLVAAALAAVVLAAALSPFGIENLTHAREVADPKWREVAEWQPVLGLTHREGVTDTRPLRETLDRLWEYLTTWSSKEGEKVPFGSLWEFAAALDVLLALWLLRRLAWLRSVGQGRASPRDITADKVGVVVFETVLSGLVIVMAFTSRRFIPLAMAMLAPILAAQISWLLSPRRWRWLAWAVLSVQLVGAVALALGAREYARKIILHYDPENPLHDRETFLQRMILFSDMFPPDAAQFINDNRISGRILQEWRWEGYLRWRCPQLKLHIGGRAQQAYTVEEFELRENLLTGRVPARKTLADMGVHLVIVPPRPKYLGLLRDLAFGPEGTWASVYFDSYATVLVDTAYPETRELAIAALRGRLRYPSEDIELASRAMLMESTPLYQESSPQDRAATLKRAVALRPRPEMYMRMPEARTPHEIPLTDEQVAYLLAEFDRLGTMDEDKARGIVIAFCRQLLARYIARHYFAAGDRAMASAWASRARTLNERVDRIKQDWKGP